jgi:hypothetical protein
VLDIQRELPHSIAWTIGYVGNKGTHNGNSIGNFNDALPSSNTDVQFRRPYQQYYDPALPKFGIQTVSTIRYLDSYGNSFYEALQTKVDKRFARGISMGAAYNPCWRAVFPLFGRDAARRPAGPPGSARSSPARFSVSFRQSCVNRSLATMVSGTGLWIGCLWNRAFWLLSDIRGASGRCI